MKRLIVATVAATMLGVVAAHAQVATNAPQGDNPTGGSNTHQPLTKPNNNGVPVLRNRQVAARMPRIVTESDAAFIAEERRDDKGMNICIGCD